MVALLLKSLALQFAHSPSSSTQQGFIIVKFPAFFITTHLSNHGKHPPTTFLVVLLGVNQFVSRPPVRGQRSHENICNRTYEQKVHLTERARGGWVWSLRTKNRRDVHAALT